MARKITVANITTGPVDVGDDLPLPPHTISGEVRAVNDTPLIQAHITAGSLIAVDARANVEED